MKGKITSITYNHPTIGSGELTIDFKKKNQLELIKENNLQFIKKIRETCIITPEAEEYLRKLELSDEPVTVDFN